jgi:membrane protein YqaA with SNARE-associated domain
MVAGAVRLCRGQLLPDPPHPVLGLMCLAQPERAIRFAIITTLASVAGGVLGYAIGHFAVRQVGKSCSMRCI